MVDTKPDHDQADADQGHDRSASASEPLTVVPNYPDPTTAPPSTSTQPTSAQLSSPNKDPLAPTTTSPVAPRVQIQELSPAKSEGSSRPPGHQKKKSIGSKILSKIKHSTSSMHDIDNNTYGQSRSGSTSGSRTPFTKSENDDENEHDDDSVKADQLKEALTQEQQRRRQDGKQQRQTSMASSDGLRHRRSLFRSRKSTQLPAAHQHHQQHDSQDEDDRPNYISLNPTDLDREESQASRHFPGDLYEHEDSPPRRSSMPSGTPTQGVLGLSAIDPDNPHDAHHSPLFRSQKDLYDAGLTDDEMDLIADKGRHSFESADSDDTLTHLIREAEGYDTLRHSRNGELPSEIDYETLKKAAHDSEYANSDSRTDHSAVSGGASKALSKPLLELEDIELETFLQNFARHTREVTVTRSGNMQQRRMPKWSDFKVSTTTNNINEGSDGEAAASHQHRRPSMLARVDRGLQHLTDGLQNSAAGKLPTKTSTSESKKSAKRRRSEGYILDESSEPHQAAASEAEDEILGSPASTKRSKDKTSKKAAKERNAKDKDKGRDQDDEDWDLIVPSASETPQNANIALPEELHVNGEDEGVDGVAFCIAYILALVEQLAPEEIDHHPERGYREGLIRSHLERLYTIAPFWEQLAHRIRRLYRWEDPKTTAAAAMVYFVLWYTDMIPTAFILMLMFYIMRFKYFPPSESYLHEKVKQRMARGQAANTLSEKLRRRSRLDILNLYKRWVVTYGAPTQEAMGLIADFHEKIKNLVLWRNPAASRRTLILFGALNLFVTFAPAHYVYKTLMFFLGITFFCLLPLQSYFPSHRKALSPLWWATFGAPTDAQFAVQILRKRHLDVDRFAGSGKTAAEVRRAVRAHGGTGLRPRPDRREEGISYDDLDDSARLNQDYVETSKDATLKPRKLGSFFCQYKGLPGRLHINTRYLYFTPLHSPSQKRGHTPVEAIESLVKTKNIRLWVWNSLGLKVVRNNGKSPMLLANVQNRDDAFNLILAVSTNGR